MSGFDVDLNISGRINLTPELIELLREIFQQTPAPPPTEPEPTPDPDPTPPPTEPEPTPPVEPDPPVEDPRYQPKDNSLVFHVSSSQGSDSNDGSVNSPLRTLSAAYQRVRSGHPDFILLKRGDVWTNESFSGWRRGGGESAEAPMVIGSYGTGNRPVVKTGAASAFDSSASSSPSVDHLVIKDIVFIAHTRNTNAGSFIGTNGSSGIRILTGANDFELYNCGVYYYTGGVVLQEQYGNPVSNCLIHYCNIHGSYASRSQGMYFDSVTDSVIDHCVIDSNGYNKSLGDEMQPDVYSHNMYIQYNCNNITVSNCLIGRASSHGLQLRCSGMVEDNIFVRNPIALQLGHREDTGGPKTTRAYSNVILEGTEITPTLQRAWGIHLEMRNQGYADVDGNIVAHAVQPSRNSRSIFVDDTTAEYAGNVIYNWPVDSREYGNGFGETLEDPDAVYDSTPTFEDWVEERYHPGMDSLEFLDHISFLELQAHGHLIDSMREFFQSEYRV